MNNKKLIIIGGPTGIGKTDLGIGLAKFLDTEVISADSRQVFKEMFIGTARPSTEEMQNIKHHLIAHRSIVNDYSADIFAQEAKIVLADIFKDKNIAIMVGGSGFYIDALLFGLDEIPKVPDEIRESLNRELEEFGIEKLQEELKEKDSEHYDLVDINNKQRLIRALEVIRFSSKPISSFKKGRKSDFPYEFKYFALDHKREVIYSRINKRVDKMIDNGLIEEVRSLLAHRNLNALNTVGYKEIFEMIDGDLSREEAIEKIKMNTRRFAKRQLTWLRSKDYINWIDLSKTKDPMEFLKTQI